MATRRKSASANPPCVKYQLVANTYCESDREDDMEVDDTPLTRVNIPKIFDAILNNFSKEGTSLRDDTKITAKTIHILVSN